MTISTYKCKSIFVSCAVLFVQACATTPPLSCQDGFDCLGVTNSPSKSEEVTLGLSSYKPEYVIANDLINALIQTPNFKNKQPTIKLPNSNSTFMSAVHDVLIQRGFRVGRSQQRTGPGVLMLSTLKEYQNNAYFTYMLAIDRVAMKRTYVIEDRNIAPVSSLFVRGISPSLITLNDGLFVE